MTHNILSLYVLSFCLAIFFRRKNKIIHSKIEPCACAFKADSGLKTSCYYLIVPENRSKPGGKTIKLPFFYVESNNPNKHKDPVLYTAGGPGASSLNGTRIHYRAFMKDRDYIGFEQRGVTKAQPCLSCDGMGEAVKQAYRKNLPLDSISDWMQNKKCRKALIAKV